MFKPTLRIVCTVCSVSLVMALVSPSQAVLIVTPSTTAGNELAYPASLTDLINTGQPTLGAVTDSGYTNFGTFAIGGLNDGTLGVPSVGTPAATFDLDGTWTSTFNLNLLTGTASLGYEITEIRTIAGWAGDRAGQQYTLEYSTVGTPAFISLGSFSVFFAPTGSSQITLTDTTGIIASGVDALRFSFVDPATGSATVYRELDVFGAELSVPEPSTLTLLVIGVVGLSIKNRRRARQVA